MKLSPQQITNVLKETALAKPVVHNDLEEMMNENSLSKGEVLETLGSLMRGADTSAVRLNSAKTALQLHGMLDDTGPVHAPITIIIKDSEFQMNPILFPR